MMQGKWYFPAIVLCLLVLAGCGGQSASTATPTVDPAIYNQVPDTTVFEPGQCSVVLSEPESVITKSSSAM